MADGPNAPIKGADVKQTETAPPPPVAPKRLSWPQSFDPKKQGKGFPLPIPATVWSLIHGSGDPAAGIRAGGMTPFDYPTDPPTQTPYGEAGSFTRHVGEEDECPRCGARVSQVTRKQGLVCIGCGGIRVMEN